MRDNRIKNMLLSALLVALVTVGAFLRIPTPWATFTLQLPFALLAGLLLGRAWGTAAIAVYVAAGLIGLPLFAGGGGISYVLQPTFGYVLALIPAVLVSGTVIRRNRSTRRLILASLCGVATVYAMGVSYAFLVTRFWLSIPHAARLTLLGALITLPKDILLCVGAAALAKRLLPILEKERF